VKFQAPVRSRPEILIGGFIIAALAAILYIEYGEWGMVPGLNKSQPAAAWARVVFFPGLLVGKWSYSHFFSSWFAMKTAINCAGIVGVIVTGLTGAIAAAMLLPRK